MLDKFLIEHRAALMKQCRAKAAARHPPDAGGAELEHGIPLFLEQLIKALRVEQTSRPLDSRAVSVPGEVGHAATSDIGGTAARHGLELLQHGFTVGQVVHGYGDLVQAITAMAHTQGVAIQAVEFQTLNRCLDHAIANAVTGFTDGRETFITDREARSQNEQTGVLGHELRNLIHIAKHAFGAIKRGKVAPEGATGAALERSLDGISTLIDRALVDVRLIARMPVATERVSLCDLVAQIKVAASLEAQARECQLAVAYVDPTLAVDVNPRSLMAAIVNLLQNAFKFTHPHSLVALAAYADGDRVRIDVKDQCGGLPHGFEATMFLLFTQGNADKSGLGLGLSIARRIVESHQGILSVRDAPGIGCVFTIDLPRHAMPSAVAAVAAVDAGAAGRIPALASACHSRIS